jgi:hypothetical protein
VPTSFDAYANSWDAEKYLGLKILEAENNLDGF